MLAIDIMSPEAQAVFFAIALICFAIAAIGLVLGRVNLMALGLFVFVFVFFWNALAAT
jgi:hypothetical protein